MMNSPPVLTPPVDALIRCTIAVAVGSGERDNKRCAAVDPAVDMVTR